MICMNNISKHAENMYVNPLSDYVGAVLSINQVGFSNKEIRNSCNYLLKKYLKIPLL